MVYNPGMQTNQADIECVTEALRLGLSICIRGRAGERIKVGTTRVYKNRSRKLSCEYTLTQSIMPDTPHTTHVAEHIAKLAIDLGGKLLALEAKRLVNDFINNRSDPSN